MDWVSISLSVISSLLLLWVLLLLALNTAKRKQIDHLKAAYKPIRNLLGAPDPEHNDFDNDMLMLVVRDLLVLRIDHARHKHYYPPHDVIDWMRRIQKQLGPYESDLQQLGWTRVSSFLRGQMFRTDDQGRYYISGDGSADCRTVAILAEVAEVLSHFPDPEFIEQEISRHLEDQRAKDIAF